MDKELLQKHIKKWMEKVNANPELAEITGNERMDKEEYYQAWTKKRILEMTEDGLYEYLSKLWAMLIWGNKHYVVDKIIEDNGFSNFKNRLAEIVWGKDPVEKRWDVFRKNIKGLGPAMISEILCHAHPKECMLWNRRAYVALNYLGLKNLPRHNYQMNGQVYQSLSIKCQTIGKELEKAGVKNVNLLTVDYFFWDELQVEDNLNNLQKGKIKKPMVEKKIDDETSKFIHNEVRDKLSEIGTFLGFNTRTEQKVADGSVVDTIWESTIGNMGRVIYVFEVQTKGSIDSLILNLLKSLNNPAVQGVVAVSDAIQIEKIKKHANSVPGLEKKLRYWDYEEVLIVHTSLESVNLAINNLKLVPDAF